MIGDIGGWLLLGILIAGAISFFVPVDFLGRYNMGGEFISLIVMLGVGIPLYVCATASTPIAAALILKGLSPGAALVFLLAGPATNASTITVIARLMGKRTAALYVASIAVCSITLGWMVNHLYRWFDIDVSRWVHTIGESAGSPFAVVSSAILLFLILRNFLPKMEGKVAGCGCEKPLA